MPNSSFLFCQVHPTGKSFTVSDGEGKIATVELNEPVSNVSLPEAVIELTGCSRLSLSTFSRIVRDNSPDVTDPVLSGP